MNISTTRNSKLKPPFQRMDIHKQSRKNIFHPKSDFIIDGKSLQELRKKKGLLSKKDIQIIVGPYIKEEITSIELMGVKSTFHVLFCVQTVKEKYVIKINVLGQNHPFEIEAFIQRSLRNNNIPFIPVLSEKLRENILIMNFINGKTLESFTGRNMHHLYKTLGQIFKKIHAMKGEKAGLLNVKELRKGKLVGLSKDWITFFNTNLITHLRKAAELHMIDREEIPKLRKIMTKFLPDAVSLSLLHNDPGSRNIFTNGKSITGILDWEDAIIGDPLWEIAFIHTFLFRKEDIKKFESFCEGYGVKQEKLFGNPTYWVYYFRIALLKTISRSREGYYNSLGYQIDKQRVEISLSELKRFF